MLAQAQVTSPLREIFVVKDARLAQTLVVWFCVLTSVFIRTKVFMLVREELARRLSR